MRASGGEIIAEARRLLRLAWPVALTGLNWTLLHLTDVAIVGHAGTDQLGALAAGRTLTFITIVMGISALSGVLVFAARADGAGDHGRGGEVLRAGILLGLGVGLACMVVLAIWARPLVAAAGVAPQLVDGGASVVRAMALSYPGQLVLIAAAYYLEGISRPRRPMVVNLTMLPLNAALAWAWVGGHLGLPAMGATGAALATATVSLLGAAAMLAAAWTLPDAIARGVRDNRAEHWRRALRDVPALARFGAMPALAGGLELAGFSWLIVLSTRLGAVAAAAFQMVFSLNNFAFAFAIGLGSAAGVRTGNAIGEGQSSEAWPRTLIAAGLATLLIGGFGLVYVLAAAWIVAPFSSDRAVVALAARLLAALAPFMLFDGIQVVFMSALRALGDQVAAGINGIIAFFFVTGGLGWLLLRLRIGSPGLVYAAGAGMVVAAILQAGRMAWLNRRRRAPPASA